MKGCGTALVTPFDSQGALDLQAYRRLIEWQIESGIDFLVPCGTTGESVTLSEQEYRQVVRTCVETSDGAVPVVAGAGSNNTAHAVELSRMVEEQGADAILSVAPYYNKPTQEGMKGHFRAILEAVDIPMVLYNVPGRTSSNLLPDTVLELARHERVVAVKEASGDLQQIMRIAGAKPEGLALLSGDDALTLAISALGGDGVISVVSNLIPADMTRLTTLARSSRLEAARELHYRYLELMNLNFVESSPAPVKYALSRMGMIEPHVRLPLVPLSPTPRRRFDELLQQLGLIEE
ncbi:MAG TPA: 4-hydroxy-tetrahydrodipicolinate synthase [Acidobacteriota bacterium]|nr:4-hydroxy-tetrahydrodipicolinate synthase [Acidobacteriota bacterium]